MIISLLVVTPDTGFGRLISKGLDAKRFNVFATPDFSDAIHYVRKMNCPVVVFDAALEEVELSILDIGHALRQVNDQIRLIIVKPEGQKLTLGELVPAATLSKPLSISELEKALQKMNISSI